MGEAHNEVPTNDLQPLVEYYRKRASDIEFEFLQYQIAASREIESLRNQIASTAKSQVFVPDSESE